MKRLNIRKRGTVSYNKTIGAFFFDKHQDLSTFELTQPDVNLKGIQVS